jgi:hypothetical protein
MTTTQDARRGNLGVLAGSLFVVLWLAGTIVQGMSGAGFPRPSDDMATVAGIMRAGADWMEASAGLQVLSAIALLWFASAIAARLRQVGSAGAGPELALAGGIMAAATLLFSASALISLGSTDLVNDDASAQLLYQLSFWLGGPIHVAGLGLLIVSAAYGLGLPKWLSIAGLVVGTAGLIASLSAIVPQLVLFTPIGRFLGFIWIVIATVMLALRRSPAPAAVAADEPAHA